MHPIRRLGICGAVTMMAVLAAMLPMPVSAADPSPAPVMPAASPVDWVPVDGVLGGSVPGLQVWARTPVAWTGGFAILETAAVAGSADDTTVWQQPAVWRSDFGVHWRRAALPAAVGSGLSLVAWRDGLAVIDTRQDYGGWRFVVWSSTDGVHWHRAGQLDLRPRGSLRGCGFTSPLVVGAGERLIATASCVGHGSGGDLDPRLRTVGLAARARPDIGLTAWSWTTTDGRRWSRHLITRSLDPAGAARYLYLLSPVGDGATGVACCYPPTLWWTPDGARWTYLGALPPDVPYQDALAIDAMTGAEGDPIAWLLVGDQADHPVGDSLTGGHVGLWLRRDDAWSKVAGETDWIAGSIAVDGQRATVVMVKLLPEPGTVGRSVFEDPRYPTRLDTLVTTDGGATWTISRGSIRADGCVVYGAARDQRLAIATCADEGSARLLRSNGAGSR